MNVRPVYTIVGNLAVPTVHGKLVIGSPDLDIGWPVRTHWPVMIHRSVIIPILVFHRASGHGFLVHERVAAAQGVPAPAQRGQSRPRAGAHPGDAVEQGLAGGQVGADDAGVEVHRRPQRRAGEIRLPAVGQVAQDDLGDAGEQDACSTVSDGSRGL